MNRFVPVVYGPTAAGKSALAVELAVRLGGVVINADALQLYAELEILTARPDDEALCHAPHRLYGVLPAREAGTAAGWREMALAEIDRAFASGLIPILTGGTGLYLKALIEGLSPLPPADASARARGTTLYAELGGAGFRDCLAKRDPVIAARLMPGDRQRLIRAWEVIETTGTPLSEWQARPREPGHALEFRPIGILPDRAGLYDKIDRRFRDMVARGALDEAAAFDTLALPLSLPANKALGLDALRRHLRGEIALEAAIGLAQQASRNYAKRQMTWFRHQMTKSGAAPSPLLLSEITEAKLAEIMDFLVPRR